MAVGFKDGTVSLMQWAAGTEDLASTPPQKETVIRQGKGQGQGLGREVTSLAFDRDEKTLAVGHEDGTIRLIQVPALPRVGAKIPIIRRSRRAQTDSSSDPSGALLRRLLDKETGTETAGLEEGAPAAAAGLGIPPSGLPLTWYSTLGKTGDLVSAGLMDILDPNQPRLVVPLADLTGDSVFSVQEGSLSDDVLAGLEEAGITVRRFALDSVPPTVPGRENVYVVMVTAGSERSVVPDLSAIVINLSPGSKSAPRTLREMGALVHAARAADRRVLWVGVIYRSGLQNAIIAIDTQL